MNEEKLQLILDMVEGNPYKVFGILAPEKLTVNNVQKLKMLMFNVNRLEVLAAILGIEDENVVVDVAKYYLKLYLLNSSVEGNFKELAEKIKIPIVVFDLVKTFVENREVVSSEKLKVLVKEKFINLLFDIIKNHDKYIAKFSNIENKVSESENVKMTCYEELDVSKFKNFNDKVVLILGILSGKETALQQLGLDQGLAKIFRSMLKVFSNPSTSSIWDLLSSVIEYIEKDKSKRLL